MTTQAWGVVTRETRWLFVCVWRGYGLEIGVHYRRRDDRGRLLYWLPFTIWIGRMT